MPDSSAPSILIVDDTPENITLLRGLLKSDYRIKIATNGVKALELAEADSPPDLILLDIMMPEMDGYEVCRRLKASEPTRDIPVIFLTAKAQVDDEAEGLELGAVDYIVKPISPSVVQARVRTHVTLKLAQEQLKQQNQLIRKAFGRYESDDVLEHVLQSEDGLELGGDKREVTLLFSDLRNFTGLVHDLPAESTVTIVNEFLGAATGIILNNGGYIVDFLGDGIFTVFGAPRHVDDHATRALACAVELQSAMPAVNERLNGRGLPGVALGVGIATGSAVVGNIGSLQRIKYSVVGSVVNEASRIESATVGGQILAAQSTIEACGSPLVRDTSFEIPAKGVKHPVLASEIAGVGAPYHVAVPDRAEDQLWPLPTPLQVTATPIAGKALSEAATVGRLTHLAKNRALLEAPLDIPRLTNLRLALQDRAGHEVATEIYAKLIRAPHGQTLSLTFTGLSGEAKALLQYVLADAKAGAREGSPD